jgi:hypothetical protein
VRLGPLLLITAGAAAAHFVVAKRRDASRGKAATEPVADRAGSATGNAGGIARASRRALGTARSLIALHIHLLVLTRRQRDVLLGQSSSPCSLTAALAYIATAIAMLGSASALAAIFFNIPALIAAIGLVAWVSQVLIPQIRAELEAYVLCRGPSERCRMDLNINTLGQAAMLTAVAAWGAALLLQIIALSYFGSLFLAWLGLLVLATSETLKWGGVVSNIAAAAVLAALTTTVLAYKTCRDAEQAPVPPIAEPSPAG